MGVLRTEYYSVEKTPQGDVLVYEIRDKTHVIVSSNEGAETNPPAKVVARYERVSASALK